MINDIKLDSLGNSQSPKKPSDQTQATVQTKTESITVSDNLSNIASTMIADVEIPQDNARVLDMKNQIESGNYRVDTDALSEKLVQTIFSKSNGI
jgi:flagellar biosynthesis anti-sigma factor FlgM